MSFDDISVGHCFRILMISRSKRYACMHAHTHTPHIHKHTRTLVDTRTHMHAHTHTRKRTRTQTQTLTQTSSIHPLHKHNDDTHKPQNLCTLICPFVLYRAVYTIYGRWVMCKIRAHCIALICFPFTELAERIRPQRCVHNT